MLTDHELSALVAEKVCGWRCFKRNGNPDWSTHVIQERPGLVEYVSVPDPRFATDQGLALDAALKALEGRELTITEHIDGWFEAAYRHVDPDGYPGSSGWVSSCGPTLARALCFAALRAVGVEVEDDGEEGA